MAFATQETSIEAGQPIELFQFALGSEVSYFTTNPTPVTYSAITYIPLEVRREALQFSQDTRAESLTITVPASTALVRKFINSVPGQQATLTILRVHRNDGANQLVQFFKGRVLTVGFTLNGLEAEIAVVPITGELANTIPRFVFSQTCNHVLFDQGCTVASSLFRHQNEVIGVAGTTISVQGLAAKGTGWANAGYIALPSGDFRQIIQHTGDDVRVMLPFPSSPLGLTVEVFAGCDHSIATCKSKFNNVVNFGGYAWVPLKNPFSTGLNNA